MRQVYLNDTLKSKAGFTSLRGNGKTIGGDYVLRWDDETQVNVNAHAALPRRCGGSPSGNKAPPPPPGG